MITDQQIDRLFYLKGIVDDPEFLDINTNTNASLAIEELGELEELYASDPMWTEQ